MTASLKKQLKRRTLRSKATHAGWTGVMSADGTTGGGGGSSVDVGGGATAVGSCETGMPWCTSKTCDFLKSETVGSLKPLPGSMGRPLGTVESCEPIVAMVLELVKVCAKQQSNRSAHGEKNARERAERGRPGVGGCMGE